MLDSLVTLSTAQAVRSATFPIQLAAPFPASEWLLESPRERNAALDALFYDIGALSPEEAKGVALRYAAEGAIIEVGPGSAPSLRMWRNHEDFSDQHGDYAALCVAGRGQFRAGRGGLCAQRGRCGGRAGAGGGLGLRPRRPADRGAGRPFSVRQPQPGAPCIRMARRSASRRGWRWAGGRTALLQP